MTRETYKNVRKNRFTQVGNGMLWDKELTLEGKGLLSIFLSNSDDWQLNMREIIKRSRNGRDKHYSVVKELIKLGYFARVEIRKNGRFEELVYIFSDDKADVEEELQQYKNREGVFINPNKQKQTPITDIQETEKNEAEKPFTENADAVEANAIEANAESQYINNTKLNNTKINNTKDNNINQSINHKEEIINELNELYDDESFPKIILKQMSNNIDRLIDDNISPIEIVSFYNVWTEHKLSDNEFALVLGRVLKKTKGKIESFDAVMKKAAINHYEEYE